MMNELENNAIVTESNDSTRVVLAEYKKIERNETVEEATEDRNLATNNKGVAVIEIVLILVILIGIVILFRGQLSNMVNNIFSNIDSGSSSAMQEITTTVAGVTP